MPPPEPSDGSCPSVLLRMGSTQNALLQDVRHPVACICVSNRIFAVGSQKAGRDMTSSSLQSEINSPSEGGKNANVSRCLASSWPLSVSILSHLPLSPQKYRHTISSGALLPSLIGFKSFKPSYIAFKPSSSALDHDPIIPVLKHYIGVAMIFPDKMIEQKKCMFSRMTWNKFLWCIGIPSHT